MSARFLQFCSSSVVIPTINKSQSICFHRFQSHSRSFFTRSNRFRLLASVKPDHEDDNSSLSAEKQQSNFSLNTVSERIKQVKTQYQLVSEEVQTLEASPAGFVLGSDLSTYQIGRSSTIQDIPIHSAPTYFGLSPAETLHKIDKYLSNQQVSSDTHIQLQDQCREELSQLRSIIHQIADVANQVLSSPSIDNLDVEQKAIDATILLLEMANFAILPQLQTVKDPPSMDALPLAQSFKETLDPKLLTNSYKFLNHLDNSNEKMSDYYPYILVATRGVSVHRQSGVLLFHKLGAIERFLYKILRTPINMFIESQRTLLLSLRNETNYLNRLISSPCDFEHEENQDIKYDGKVRRVIPTIRFDNGVTSLARIFLPSFVQEPTYELLVTMYREVDVDKSRLRKMKREALLEQIKDSLSQAINPNPVANLSENKVNFVDQLRKSHQSLQTPPGELKEISLKTFKDVQWGSILHYMPSVYLLPATRDLLRVDILTFLALLSAATEFFVRKHSDSLLLYSSLLASFITYAGRIIIGWQRVLTSYRGKISNDKANNVISQGEGSPTYLAKLAVEEIFVRECCRIISEHPAVDANVEELQKEIFGKSSPDNVKLSDLEQWLKQQKQ